MNIEKLKEILDRDYYKPIRTDAGFDERNDDYIEYTSKANGYENLSPKKYLNVIIPYLRNLINDCKPIMELNNNNKNYNDTSATTNSNRAEWKIQLVIKNNFISVKDFEDTRTIFSKSEPVEIFMGSDTENIIDTLFNTILNRIQEAMETSNERGSGFTHDSVGLLYYHFQRIDIRRGESYIVSPDWIASKKATINPKNEKDNKCFQWAIIAGLNYNKINENEWKRLLKFRRTDTDFSLHQRGWEEFEQKTTSIALNILLLSHDSEEVKLPYKSIYNERKNQVILLMINDQTNNCYYFAVKNMLELNSSGWLRPKKEAIINNNNNNTDNDSNFQNALDDALNYQTNEKNLKRISKLKVYINNCNWEGTDFPAEPKE